MGRIWFESRWRRLSFTPKQSTPACDRFLSPRNNMKITHTHDLCAALIITDITTFDSVDPSLHVRATHAARLRYRTRCSRCGKRDTTTRTLSSAQPKISDQHVLIFRLKALVKSSIFSLANKLVKPKIDKHSFSLFYSNLVYLLS